MAKDRSNVQLKVGDEVTVRAVVKEVSESDGPGANVTVEPIGGSDKARPGSFSINSSYTTQVSSGGSAVARTPGGELSTNNDPPFRPQDQQDPNARPATVPLPRTHVTAPTPQR